MARTSDLELFLATDSSVLIDVVDSAEAAQTMTGWSLAFVLRSKSTAGGGTTILSKATGGSGITIGNGSGTNDRATIAIADTDLPTTITPGRGYQAALWRTDAGSDTPLWYGNVTLLAVAQQAS